MKKCFFVLAYFLLLLPAFSQSYMKLDYLSFYDKSYIDSMIGKQKYEKYLIYQTMLQNDSLVYGENVDQIATFLFWLKNDTVYIKLITKKFIYKTEKGFNCSIFNYKYIDKVGADSEENSLNFVPPILAPFNSDVVIYKSYEKEFFFEFGTVHLYVENPEKYVYRKEVIEVIKKEIGIKLGKFKPESNNFRKPLFDSDNDRK